LRRRYPAAFEGFTEREIKTLADVVGMHETPMGEIERVARRIGRGAPRKRIVFEALVLADKLFEASGYRVLERRAFFVGKERLKKDLAYLRGEYGKKAPLYAVAMESCMRLRAINALGDYPKWIRPIAKPLHEIQTRFYFGLLKHLGLSERQLVKEMERINFPKFSKYKDKINAEVAKANSSNRIKRLDADVALSAAELVGIFVKADSPNVAIKGWRPRGKAAREWLTGIGGARSGNKEYLRKLEVTVRRALGAAV
jgi:hypothetical protein